MNNPYQLKVSLNVIPPLGDGLYSNTAAILSELIANASDADASCVFITIEGENKIIIKDNGQGMTQQEISDHYLTVGFQKRKTGKVVTPKYARHVMGRKGIGKLSVFSLANIVEVHTVKDGQQHAFRLNYHDLQKAINGNETSYSATPITPDLEDLNHGTIIILTDIKLHVLGKDQVIRTQIARRFLHLGQDKDFTVFFNGAAITLEDRKYYDKVQFLWYIGDEGVIYKERATNAKEIHQLKSIVDPGRAYKITGWVGTTFKPGDIPKGHHTIALYAHDKLAQEDILAEYNLAEIVSTYLVGEIQANFLDLDDETDMTISNRQKVNENDPRYVLLREFIYSEVIRQVAKSWPILRNKLKDNANNPTETDETINNPTTQAQDSSTSHEQSSDKGSSSTSQDYEQPSYDGSESTSQDNEKTSEEGKDKDFPEPELPPKREIPSRFKDIRSLITISPIEEQFKSIALYDLNQAAYAYRSGAYKACVVMLGAVLEGIMLGTVRRSDFMELMMTDPNPSDQVNKMGGVKNSKLIDRTQVARFLSSNKFGFQDYRELVERYIPNTNKLGVEQIQNFRNAVHPAVVAEKPAIFGKFTSDRAMNYIISLFTLVEHLTTWKI